ncbi:hypothetical protein PoB_005577500, partial [Plakobranchus ocellatus]
MWINGIVAEQVDMVIYNGDVITIECTVHLGKDTSMNIGVVYRGGMQTWFENLRCNHRTETIVVSKEGDLKEGISSGEAEYVFDPRYGLTIKANLTIKVFPPLEGLITICHRDRPLNKPFIDFSGRQDSRGIWSKPLVIYYFPKKPMLRLEAPQGSEMFGGDHVVFSCESFIRRNGTLLWRFTTASHVYVWNKKSSVADEPHPYWVTIENKQEVENYDDFHGPQYYSKIQLVMHSNFMKARLECLSDTEDGYFIHPLTKENITTSDSTVFRFIVKFAVSATSLVILPIDRNKLMAHCSADVGTGGRIQWRMEVSDWLIYCWTVDPKGNTEGNSPPFLIQDENGEGHVNFTQSNLTGPHLKSTIKFKKPAEWQKSNLKCSVDNPYRDFMVRTQDKNILSTFRR